MEDWFKNKRALSLRGTDYRREITALDLESFPVVQDFSVRLRATGALGHHLEFVSQTLGVLASFPWWDHVERHVGGMAPMDLVGTAESPYDDLEQGWQIVIWKDAAYVYVLEGDEPCATEFRSWFKVPISVWIDAWLVAIGSV